MVKKKNSLATLSDAEFLKLKQQIFSSKNVQKYFQKIKSAKSLAAVKTKLTEADRTTLTSVVEEEIRRQIEQLCFIQYAIMQKTNNWTEVGQERILHSLTRMFQNIASNAALSFEMIWQTQELLTKQIYQNFSLAELEKKEQCLHVDLGWKKLRFSHYQIINDFLEIINSDKRLILGQMELYSSIIFGKATISKQAQLTVYTFHQELIHTPAIITSIAGMLKEKEIIIREKSAETIFYNKWLTAFKQIKSTGLPEILNNQAENTALAFKLKTLLAYQASTEKKLLRKKKLFIQEILEGLLWHEMGHAITLNYFMNRQQVILDEALSVLGETSSAVTKELLADYAPTIENSPGPLNFICNCSVRKAQRMIMVYLSDNWFICAEDNFFRNHTELITANLLEFINDSGKFQKTSLQKVLEKKYQKILTKYNEVLDKLLKELTENKYRAEGESLSFEDIVYLYQQQYQQVIRNFSKKEKECYILARIIKDLEKLNPAVYRYIRTSLEELNQLYHYQINQGKETTLAKIYRQLQQKNLYLKTDLDFEVLKPFLEQKQIELIEKQIAQRQDLEIIQVSENSDWLEIFGLIFYSLEIIDSKKLDAQQFITTWEKYSHNYLTDYFYFLTPKTINFSILFSLLFQTIFRLAPESLFTKQN